MQAPHRAKPAASNIYTPLSSAAATPKQSKRKKDRFTFSSEPPTKPLTTPQIEFEKCVVSEMATVCTRKLDETRYPLLRSRYLLSIQPLYDRKIRVLSWNVLLKKPWENNANPSHPAYDPSKLWCNRVKHIAAAINLLQPDIIGCQELYEGKDFNQEDDLYAYIGLGYERYSTKAPDGEHNTIFLKRKTFTVIHTHTFVCAEKTFGFVVAYYKDKKIKILNGHLSFEVNARETQARFLASRFKEEFKEDDHAIVTLDTNFTPNNPFNAQTPAGWDGPYTESLLLEGRTLEDAYSKSLFGNIGSLGTYTNDELNIEPFNGLGTPGVRLDRIYVKKLEVFVHAIEPFMVKKKPASDHQAVIVDVLIPTSTPKH